MGEFIAIMIFAQVLGMEAETADVKPWQQQWYYEQMEKDKERQKVYDELAEYKAKLQIAVEALERILKLGVNEIWDYDDNGYTTGGSYECDTCVDLNKIAKEALEKIKC